MEKGMATHSSILAWKIPWTEEPGRLWGLKESPPILVFSRVLSCTCGFRVKLIHYIKCYTLILHLLSTFLGFPDVSVVKESACQCSRHRFEPWDRKMPWRRKWQPTAVFLPGESHGQRSLEGYSPWGRRELETTEC